MINFSAYSIKNPLPSILLFIVLCIWGLFSFQKLKVQDFPDIDLPMVRITVFWSGSTPAQMEAEVVRKIEGSITSTNGIKNIYSSIRDDFAVITAEFILEKSGDTALDDIQTAVNRVRGDLPASVQEPQIAKIEFTASPILAYSISADNLSEEELSWYIDNNLSKQLQNIRSVGSVSRIGGVNRQINININLTKLWSLGITPAEISHQLGNISQDASGGIGNIGGAEQSMRTIGSAQNIDELYNLPIVLANERVFKLKDLADIKDEFAKRSVIAQFNGKKIIGIEVTRALGADPILLAQEINNRLAEIVKTQPGLSYKKIFDFVEFTEDNYKSSMELLYEGAFLAVIVVWFFLRNMRSTLITCISLPLSIIPTFIALKYFGFSLNMVTLLAISLVVGILVDDAIVEIENIIRHLNMGKTPYQAAMDAADEIGLAVIATTFTIIAVFLPTAFMDGVSGKFFKQFGWTASIAVFASLVVARLLIPMMAAYLIKPLSKKLPEAKPTHHLIKYLQLVNWCLTHRKITIFASLVFFIGSTGLVVLLPKNFMNTDESTQTLITYELPYGSSLDNSYKKAEEIRQLIKDVPEVESIYTTVGGGKTGADVFAIGNDEVRKGQLSIRLKHLSQRKRSKKAIESEFRKITKKVSGIRFAIGLGSSGGSGRYQMAISSDNENKLANINNIVITQLRSIQNIGNISSNASLQKTEVVIRPDPVLAANYGVTTAQIAATIRLVTSGDYYKLLPKLNLPQRQIPMVIKVDDEVRENFELIKKIPLVSSKGLIMLSEVAQVKLENSPAQINRFNRARNINYEIELDQRSLEEVTKEVDNLPIIKNLPTGITKVKYGDAEEFELLIKSFLIAMSIGTLCVFLVLVLLFHDVLQPVSILMALPLCFGGSFLALLIFGYDFSMSSMIGLIMLMGIATKNSILLVEYAMTARKNRGLNRTDAIIDACSKRARPIIMTSIAMSAGMLPSALGFSGDPSFRSPMAVSVIGGLVTSTFLSLVIIPVVYTYFDDLHDWIKTKFCHKFFE